MRMRMMKIRLHFWVSVSLLLSIHGQSFSLPSITPRDYSEGDFLNVKVKKLTSPNALLSYPYYFLHYCRPNHIVESGDSLGRILRGDRLQNSPYWFKMRQPQMCNVICRIVLDEKSAKEFKDMIDKEYRVNMVLDDLPLVQAMQSRDANAQGAYQQGFLVGFKGGYVGSNDYKYYVHNHLSFEVKLHSNPETDSVRIVGFQVTPFSVKHEYETNFPDLTTCNSTAKPVVQDTGYFQQVEDKREIIFTYDVEFHESEVKWESRWDAYLLINDDQIRWFSSDVTFIILAFLSCVVALMVLHSFRKCTRKLLLRRENRTYSTI